MSIFTETADKLQAEGTLSLKEFETLLLPCSPSDAEYLQKTAQETTVSVYGKNIYIRGLIEFTDYCKNSCLYCGIRLGNPHTMRYRMTEEEILSCCKNGYKNGFRTFVLQGGEDGYFTDSKLCKLITSIKSQYPDCAVTLSVGERSRSSYEKLKAAGADRYLLRHETANEEHYQKLHPAEMSYSRRMDCLKNLKELGYQTGCGFMVGSPYQTIENIAEDLRFMSEFKPEMAGIGPFIPHSETPFAAFQAGSADLTIRILSIVRLMLPRVLLPATTALASIDSRNRIKGILAGANVIMPNLSPVENRDKYSLYNNKASLGAESAEGLALLERELAEIGYKAVVDRGDCK